ncbi:hypothetical protein TYRP_018246 [Tyrophagus putrescentiae]|nr:hypothetical protein TYRP_018246 [Tyrophagus putrescentiae]
MLSWLLLRPLLCPKLGGRYAESYWRQDSGKLSVGRRSVWNGLQRLPSSSDTIEEEEEEEEENEKEQFPTIEASVGGCCGGCFCLVRAAVVRGPVHLQIML